MQSGENSRNRNRVGDVGLATKALLSLVRFRAELVRREYAADVFLGQVGFELI